MLRCYINAFLFYRVKGRVITNSTSLWRKLSSSEAEESFLHHTATQEEESSGSTSLGCDRSDCNNHVIQTYCPGRPGGPQKWLLLTEDLLTCTLEMIGKRNIWGLCSCDQFWVTSDLRAKRCSWVWQVERVYRSSCWPARCYIWASPPGGVSPPANGARSQASWPCPQSPPGFQRALYECQWGTEHKRVHIEQITAPADMFISKRGIGFLCICQRATMLYWFILQHLFRFGGENILDNCQPLLSSVMSVLHENTVFMRTGADHSKLWWMTVAA